MPIAGLLPEDLELLLSIYQWRTGKEFSENEQEEEEEDWSKKQQEEEEKERIGQCKLIRSWNSVSLFIQRPSNRSQSIKWRSWSVIGKKRTTNKGN